LSNKNASTKRAKVRCAIYTRKSSEEGLEQEFNSLDAQRDSAEAYIKSQAAEGWVCVPESFDDGGFSGGNMDRPAVKRLMSQIEAGRIDCVVVYKVDRLSRSLLDFARMMEIFDRHGIAFVSVTQQFNTASSMGRLILNVLLSFAQFEREMISERTRDKIAAARRKGKWAGGMPILGYDVINRKLVINDAEAIQVRTIFELYQTKGSLLPVVQELERRGWGTKSWTTQKGNSRGGKTFSKPSLYKLLRNATYTGKVRYKQEAHNGEHMAIVGLELFEGVQTILNGAGSAHAYYKDHENPPLLRGLLRCKHCNCAMVHSFTARGARRYRYYLCNNAQGRGYAVCPSPTAPAPELERFILEEVLGLARDPELINILAARDESDAETDNTPIDPVEMRLAFDRFGTSWESWSPREQAARLASLVRTVQYDGRAGKVDVALKAAGVRKLIAESLVEELPK
jgi:site-specific DNA recombinase